jgi:hypothetical protein
MLEKWHDDIGTLNLKYTIAILVAKPSNITRSTLSATKTGLEASAAASLSLSTNLQATVDSIQNVDQVALQAKLQQLNNQQAIDYYLISQMNTAAASALTIFR